MTASFAYLEELYRQWQTDEASVDPRWDDFFRSRPEAITSPVVNQSLTYKQSRVDSLLWAYRDVGYDGVCRPDHIPTMEGDSNDQPMYSQIGRLYAIGYITGLREAVYAA